MKLKKLIIGFLLILLVAGVSSVSASAPDASRAYSPSVQEIAQEIPGWLQVNSNGFGDPLTGEVSALEAFNGYLYAGTYNPINPAPGQLYDGAQIFRSQNGMTWSAMTLPGFGDTHDIAPPAILDLTIFNGYIYASTGRGGNAAQIRRSGDGENWPPMVIDSFADPDNQDITALAEYDGKIYAGVTNQNSGPLLWSSFTGDNNSWTQVTQGDPGTPAASVTGFAVFDGGLYGAVETNGPAQVWVSYGTDWAPVRNDGFGNSNTTLTGGMAVFSNTLYIGAGNTEDGAHLLRTNNGADWFEAIDPGFGDTNNQKVEVVFVFQNQLYVSVKNAVTGIELWRSADGTVWEQANQDGFGDINNSSSNWSNATADFLGHFYIGTSNVVDGGEVWRMLQKYNFFPLIIRDP